MVDPAPTARRMPVGWRFHPTDEELVGHYLRHKLLADDPSIHDTIPEIDVCKNEPWDLLDGATSAASAVKFDDFQCFFFSPLDYKYPNSTRSNRATLRGFWKVTGRDRKIRDRDTNSVIGTKKLLVFYERQGPRRCKTNWVIHEYHCLLLPHDQTTHILCWLKKNDEKKTKEKSHQVERVSNKHENQKEHSFPISSRSLFIQTTLQSNEITGSGVQTPLPSNEITGSVFQISPQSNEITDLVSQTLFRSNEITSSVIQTPPQSNEITGSVIQIPPQSNEITSSVIQIPPQSNEITDLVIQTPPQSNEITGSVIPTPSRPNEITGSANSVIQTLQSNEVMDSVIQNLPQLNEVTGSMIQNLPQLNEESQQSNEVIKSTNQVCLQPDEDIDFMIRTFFQPDEAKNATIQTLFQPGEAAASMIHTSPP